MDVLGQGPWFVILNGHLRQVARRHTTAPKTLSLELGLDEGISFDPDHVEVASPPGEPTALNDQTWPGWTPVPLPWP